MPNSDDSVRLWGGRFAGGPADAMAALSLSTHFDWRLAPYDLQQTKAHARVLNRAGLLTDDELQSVEAAIDELFAEVASGAAQPSPQDEDVHTAVERILMGKLGDLGGKLRAGRSRNDQVATDFRLFLRDAAAAIANATLDLIEAINTQASDHIDTASPGFTHLQHAQPLSFGHELAKHSHALLRDVDRLADWDRRTSRSPLGAGALAGSSLQLDPQQVAEELGFDAALANSVDAVSDRDFVAEFCFVGAMIGVHLSRIGEEVILMASREFAWAKLHDEWSTG
ncbi:MAG TPA: argininosuccinate lyase, partial [Candidatus Nanopelagicales bacterium]|nr:argininosuccinate lyase [Candidatus Nanopelagicales bacterium]